MNINEWFTNDCPYTEGLILYEQIPGHNKFLLRKLQQKHTQANLVKLRYELQKHLQPTLGSSEVDVTVAKAYKKEEESKYYRKVLLRDLPFELHEPYRKQKDHYYKATSLHIQLTSLQSQDQQKALALCLEIDSLFTSIEKKWELIDFYFEYGHVPEIKKEDLSVLNETQLLLKRVSRRSSLTRAKVRLQKLQTKLNNTLVKSDFTKISRKLADKEAHIIKLKLDIDLLDMLITKNKQANA